MTGRSLQSHEDAERALAAIRSFVLMHPIASQKLFAACVAEGRAFATTPKGSEMLARVASSELVHRLEMVWESASAGALDASSSDPIPSAMLETLTALAASSDLTRLLSSWFAEGLPE